MLDDKKILYQYSNRPKHKHLCKTARKLLPIEECDFDFQLLLLIAVRLLWDVAAKYCRDDTAGGFMMDNKGKDDSDDTQNANAVLQQIQTNDPTLTSLSLQIVQVPSRDHFVSYFRGFNQLSIQQATDALQTNRTIRSVSCSYEQEHPSRASETNQINEVGRHDEQSVGVMSYNRVAKLQEGRFFEACICLPQLESISLTGGHRWKLSHLITILDTAKKLRKLVVRDILIKSRSELNGLKRIFMGDTKRNYRTLSLESIELTIEDQTGHESDHWSIRTITREAPSTFDLLLEALISSPNTMDINLSKSVLSRFHLRKLHDVSASTLLKVARCKSLEKLILSDISVEEGGIEAMCEALIQQNGHLSKLEFYGCAFTQSVGQSDWNSMFRLIQHDPTIQIRASSLVYGERFNPNYIRHEGVFESSFVQRPHEEFSFSLRDKEGSRKHFRNRCLGIRYMLQEVGFFQMIQSKQQLHSSEWVHTMARVRNDSIALFYILRENPALCSLARSN